ncbi:hypothetical protein TWF696_003488 [Orbilia brochopaga]|uniref:Uncharacterized protein n=1 Tax=Orbilia brochopaga TaxID=3140254 RepID=A0AAV9TXJ1_9PEZI
MCYYLEIVYVCGHSDCDRRIRCDSPETCLMRRNPGLYQMVIESRCDEQGCRVKASEGSGGAVGTASKKRRSGRFREQRQRQLEHEARATRSAEEAVNDGDNACDGAAGSKNDETTISAGEPSSQSPSAKKPRRKASVKKLTAAVNREPPTLPRGDVKSYRGQTDILVGDAERSTAVETSKQDIVDSPDLDKNSAAAKNSIVTGAKNSAEAKTRDADRETEPQPCRKPLIKLKFKKDTRRSSPSGSHIATIQKNMPKVSKRSIKLANSRNLVVAHASTTSSTSRKKARSPALKVTTRMSSSNLPENQPTTQLAKKTGSSAGKGDTLEECESETANISSDSGSGAIQRSPSLRLISSTSGFLTRATNRPPDKLVPQPAEPVTAEPTPVEVPTIEPLSIEETLAASTSSVTPLRSVLKKTDYIYIPPGPTRRSQTAQWAAVTNAVTITTAETKRAGSPLPGVATSKKVRFVEDGKDGDGHVVLTDPDAAYRKTKIKNNSGGETPWEGEDDEDWYDIDSDNDADWDDLGEEFVLDTRRRRPEISIFECPS